jgi:hypothetical protein
MLQRNGLLSSAVIEPAHSAGVSMTVAVQSLLRSKPLLRRLASDICQHVAQTTPVIMTLSKLGEPDDAIQVLEMFCKQMRDAGAPNSALVGVCLDAPSVPLRAYALITRCWFGNGPRYVMPGDTHMQHPPGQSGDLRYWKYLWRHRDTRWGVLPVYGDIVSTPCPLLGDEPADAVLPTFGIQAPAGSAWLPLNLHLPRFADSRGAVDLSALTKTLITCIDIGEQTIDQQSWPTMRMRRDAQINRRLAIQLTGIGDLVRMRGASPSDLSVLQSLNKLLEHVRSTVWNRSAELARGCDLLPAIARHQPALAVSDGQHNLDWDARWQAAVERCAVRHRNLLIISPYAVLPGDGDGDACAAYTDLLPLIGFADAHSFATTAPLAGWKFKDFCRFHRRAWAVIQRRNGASLVAMRA